MGNYEYDLYVVFSDSENDTDFATKFVNGVEENYNKRCFLRDRDFVPGIKMDSFEYILEKSERVFIIYSQDTNERVHYQGNIALEKFLDENKAENRERIIPLVSDTLGKVPGFLRCFNDIRYMKPNGEENPYFWNNVKSTFSQPIGSSLPGKRSPSSTINTDAATVSGEQPESAAFGQDGDIPFADSDSGNFTSAGSDAAFPHEEVNVNPDLARNDAKEQVAYNGKKQTRKREEAVLAGAGAVYNGKNAQSGNHEEEQQDEDVDRDGNTLNKKNIDGPIGAAEDGTTQNNSKPDELPSKEEKNGQQSARKKENNQKQSRCNSCCSCCKTQ